MSEPRAEERRRVDEVLLAPLVQAGLARRRGVKVEDHEAMLERLRRRLAYMADGALRGLGELILRHSVQGVQSVQSIWPDEALIIAWAYGLQCPPPRESDYAQSLMRSALGRRARDEGWAVELIRIAKRLGPPPGRYIEGQLRRDAELARGRMRAARDAIEAGRANQESILWVAAYHADLAEVDAIQAAVAGADGASGVAA